MKITVSDTFLPLLKAIERYLLLYGGAGSGKSEFAGRKIFYRCQNEGNHRALIMRKIRARLRESVIAVMLDILNTNQVRFNYNKSDRIISFLNTNGQYNELLFDGLDDPEKIKSIKGITMVWLEEFTEFTRDDFTQIDLRLRESTEHYKQIIASFNPDEAQGPWIKQDFFDNIHADTRLHHSTIEDNPIPEVRDEYLKILERLDDKTYYDIYRRGEWALARGIIYNWDVVPGPPDNPSEVFYGGDFGYSIDPAVLLRIYRKANEFWIEELIYQTGLTNQALGALMGLHGIEPLTPIYFDSAEPKSIEEICQQGFNAKPAYKGPDSVRAGIDYLKAVTIHIIEGSENVKQERRSYKWKEDRAGNPLPVPVEFRNHAMDAARYGIFTHCRSHKQGVILWSSKDAY